MENTIIIAIVSLLCILAHVPTLILRIVPFHEKISDKDRIRLTVIYAIGLAVDFGICMWVGNYREIDVPFYKINLIAFCIVMAAVNIWLAKRNGKKRGNNPPGYPEERKNPFKCQTKSRDPGSIPKSGIDYYRRSGTR